MHNLLNMKRFKSLLWRSLAMGVAAGVAELLRQWLGMDPGQTTTIITGLLLGEVTKALNS